MRNTCENFIDLQQHDTAVTTDGKDDSLTKNAITWSVCARIRRMLENVVECVCWQCKPVVLNYEMELSRDASRMTDMITKQ